MRAKERKKQYVFGLREAIPVIFGFIPVGIAYAIMARQAGFCVGEICLMSLMVFAGASQIMAVGMVSQGAGLIAIILATFLLNLRHLIMSICVMEKMEGGRTPARLLASFGVTDESFAIFSTMKKEKATISCFFGLVTVTYLSWNAGTLIGALSADFLPEILTASFGIALFALFIALLAPSLPGNRRLTLLVLLTAVCNSLFTLVMADSTALILSTVICALFGVFFVDPDEKSTPKKSERRKGENA